MHKVQALAILALMIAATPLVDAANGHGHNGSGQHASPPPARPPAAHPPPIATPTPAPHPTPEPIPASAQAQAPNEPIVDPLSIPRGPLPTPPVRESASDRSVVSPTESRAARFDKAAADAFATVVAGRSGALSDGSGPISESSIAAPTPSQGGPSWTLPVLGLVGVGAALLLRPPSDPLRAPAGAAPKLSFTLSPIDVRMLLQSGKACVERGALDEAVAWFTQALALEPGLGVALFARGVCLAGLGRHEDAHASLAEAYALDPSEGAVRLEYARAAARTARSSAAMDALSPLLAALPEFASDVADDDAFAGLRDHPRFLAMTGRL